MGAGNHRGVAWAGERLNDRTGPRCIDKTTSGRAWNRCRAWSRLSALARSTAPSWGHPIGRRPKTAPAAVETHHAARLDQEIKSSPVAIRLVNPHPQDSRGIPNGRSAGGGNGRPIAGRRTGSSDASPPYSGLLAMAIRGGTSCDSCTISSLLRGDAPPRILAPWSPRPPLRRHGKNLPGGHRPPGARLVGRRTTGDKIWDSASRRFLFVPRRWAQSTSGRRFFAAHGALGGPLDKRAALAAHRSESGSPLTDEGWGHADCNRSNGRRLPSRRYD